MDLVSFVQILLRRWLLLVLLGVAGIGCAFLYASAKPPARYQASIRIQLNPAAKSSFLPYSGDARSDTSSVSGLAASYREVLRSRAFGELVVRRLQLTVPPEAVAAAIGAQLIPNTNILRLTVTWDNPDEAQQLARSVAETFIAENGWREQSQPGSQARLAELEGLSRSMQARLGPLRQRRERLDQAVVRGDLSRLSEFNELDLRLTGMESSYANLLVEISRMRESMDTAAILDDASPAERVDALPLPQALLFGLLGGLSVAVLVAFVLERLWDTVHGPDDVVAVSGRPPLAGLPHVGGRGRGWRRQSPDLVMLRAPRSPAAEAFRTLRTNLQLATLEQPLRTLIITSPGPREGKTFVACNLAIALAQLGKRVLLVDANLRGPAVDALFRVANHHGLMDALTQADAPAAGQSSPAPRDVHEDRRTAEGASADVVGVVPSGVERLSLLPAGRIPPDPGERLGSTAAARLIERLGELWDVVVLDAAAVGPVADTLPLAKHVDGALVIVRAGETPRAALYDALGALISAGRPALRVVLNDCRRSPLLRHSMFGYYHHAHNSDHPDVEHDTAADGRGNGRQGIRLPHSPATKEAGLDEP